MENNKKEYPDHIAIILDGNRRWAKNQRKPPLYGHKKGADAIKNTLKLCKKYKVSQLTVYAFSTENFKRSKEEVEYLMKLFVQMMKDILGNDSEIVKNKVRVRILGRKSLLPQKLVEYIKKVEDLTKDFDKYTFNVCMAYGGRPEIVDSTKQIAQKVKIGEISVDDIDEELMSSHMYMSDEPDMIIRTSEQRLSNFLTWQSVYSEIFFLPDNYWPEFDENLFLKCMEEFSKRKRRFGGN